MISYDCRCLPRFSLSLSSSDNKASIAYVHTYADGDTKITQITVTYLRMFLPWVRGLGIDLKQNKEQLSDATQLAQRAS